jgi:hypothetical protein
MPRKEKKGSFGGKEKKRKRETAAGQTAVGTQERDPGRESAETLACFYCGAPREACMRKTVGCFVMRKNKAPMPRTPAVSVLRRIWLREI